MHLQHCIRISGCVFEDMYTATYLTPYFISSMKNPQQVTALDWIYLA